MRKAFRTISSHELGRPLPRLRNAGVGGGLQSLKFEEYDYYGVSTGTSLNKQTLFSIPFGQSYTPNGGSAFNKTAYHTTLTDSGKLVNPERLKVYALVLGIINPITPNDLNNFLGSTLVVWTISGKPYVQIHANRIPSGGGPFIASTQTSVGSGNSGLPLPQAVYVLPPSLTQWIGQSQPFQVIIDPTQAATTQLTAGTPYSTDGTSTNPAGKGVNVLFYLAGYKLRLVS